MSSDFRHGVNEVFAHVERYKALVGSYLPRFTDRLSDENVGEDCLTHGDGTSGDCPETSVTDYQSTLPNIPEEQRSQTHLYMWPNSDAS